jgi:hypothetical protein
MGPQLIGGKKNKGKRKKLKIKKEKIATAYLSAILLWTAG